MTTAWAFDTAGFLTSVTSTKNGSTLDSHTYTRDAVGNITQETLAGQSNSTSTFGYDDLYRLTSASVNGTSYSWVYDPVGNGLSQTVGGVTTPYTYDSADHLLTVNGVSVTSDLDGNVPNDGAGGAYTWDVRGRLIGLTKSGNSYLFKYGPDNLRGYKSVNGVVTTYLLDGEQVVTEKINGSANQTLYGPGTDHALARNGEFFLPNHASSTTGLTDGSGNLTQSYSYGPFGEPLNAPTDSNPFQYTGRENDGDGLLYYRARYYCPAWGRFVSSDPAGFGGGINPFVYAGNNPVNHGDPSGLATTIGPDGEPVQVPDPDPTQPPAGAVTDPTGPPSTPAPNFPSAASTPPAGDPVPPPSPSGGDSNPDVTEGPYAGGTPVGNAELVPLEAGAAGAAVQPEWPIMTFWWNCFVAGTPVAMADGSTKPIEAVQPGDIVVSRNPTTGETATKRVARTFQRERQGTLVLHLASGEGIETTEGHPFFVAGAGWVPGGRLWVGAPIVTRQGSPVAVARMERTAATVRVYNFEVEGFHSYFVGHTAGGVWVHNTSLPPGQITTALGHLADTAEAPKLGYNILDIPNWTWAANWQWLDAAIARGDTFFLATDPSRARVGSVYYHELRYMAARGFVQQGAYLRRP